MRSLRRHTQKVRPQVQQAAIFLISLHAVTPRSGATGEALLVIGPFQGSGRGRSWSAVERSLGCEVSGSAGSVGRFQGGVSEGCNHAHGVHVGVGSMSECGLVLHTDISLILYYFPSDPK